MEKMGTLHWLCFKSNRYWIRCLAKCLLSTYRLNLRKDRGWGVSRAHSLWGGVSSTLLWGLGSSPARCTLLDAVPVALLSTGSGSPCVVLVPPQQYVGALGFPRSAALQSECSWWRGSCFRNRYILLQWEGLKCHLVGCLSHPHSSEQGCGHHGLEMWRKTDSNLTFSRWYRWKGGLRFRSPLMCPKLAKKCFRNPLVLSYYTVTGACQKGTSQKWGRNLKRSSILMCIWHYDGACTPNTPLVTIHLCDCSGKHITEPRGSLGEKAVFILFPRHTKPEYQAKWLVSC